MARSRNIKPGFFSNEILAECQPLARILFEGLWCIADREGRLEDRPKKIKAEILPYDNCDIDALLNELASKAEEDGKPSFIVRYKAEGKGYIQILNFKNHQNPHIKETASIIPAPDLHQISTVQEPDKNRTSPADSLNPITDSLLLITDSLKQREGEKPEDKFDPKELESRRLEVFKTFEKELGQTLSSFKITEINEWLGRYNPDLVIHALKTAILGDNRSFKYINGILQAWGDAGIKTVDDAEKREQKFQEQKRSQLQKDRASPKDKWTTGNDYEIYVPPVPGVHSREG